MSHDEDMHSVATRTTRKWHHDDDATRPHRPPARTSRHTQTHRHRHPFSFPRWTSPSSVLLLMALTVLCDTPRTAPPPSPLSFSFSGDEKTHARTPLLGSPCPSLPFRHDRPRSGPPLPPPTRNETMHHPHPHSPPPTDAAGDPGGFLPQCLHTLASLFSHPLWGQVCIPFLWHVLPTFSAFDVCGPPGKTEEKEEEEERRHTPLSWHTTTEGRVTEMVWEAENERQVIRVSSMPRQSVAEDGPHLGSSPPFFRWTPAGWAMPHGGGFSFSKWPAGKAWCVVQLVHHIFRFTRTVVAALHPPSADLHPKTRRGTRTDASRRRGSATPAGPPHQKEKKKKKKEGHPSEMVPWSATPPPADPPLLPCRIMGLPLLPPAPLQRVSHPTLRLLLYFPR